MINMSLNLSRSILVNFFLLLVFVLCSTNTSAKSVALPEDPSQSITYWKPQVIAPENSTDVALAHAVFEVLLRTWDSARVEPNLYVVKSSSGPWAASLADGNILLSQNAIEVSKKYGKQYTEHLLAFILGHELAHQRAEDLWHQRFLRLAGSQAPEIQARLLKDLKINPDSIADLG
jgi:Zn-dependent protease with chaperone function